MFRFTLVALFASAAAVSTGCITYTAQDGSGIWFCDNVSNMNFVTPQARQWLNGYYGCVQQQQDGTVSVKIVNEPF